MQRFGQFLIVAIFAVGAGVYIGANYREPLKASPIPIVHNAIEADPDVRETPDGSTKFTSPLLECAELPETVSNQVIKDTKSHVQSIIDSRKASGDVSEVSVYYRDLNNDLWFGINEDENYFPASLLKLPLAMSYYDKAEDDPTLLSHQITFVPDPTVTKQLQPFAGPDNLVPGKKYTVQQLLDLMLKESNNDAANALAVFGGTDVMDNVYHDLGLALPQPGQDYSISTHKYASFFRVLYNATYIDKKASEAILRSLGDTTFNQGLSAGVPSTINVSNKFGTRQVDNAGTVQLHDCGIIYAPKKPYVLCVMTQGHDFNKLADVIKNISASVYNDVTAATTTALENAATTTESLYE